MAKKQFFFLCDVETTEKDTVADFCGIIIDRQGKIYNEIAVLVEGHYGKFKLFHDVNSADEIWTIKGLKKRNEVYKNMLNTGQRMLASVNGINKWLAQAHRTYPNLIFTAYNSNFDLGKMANTGIDTEGFEQREFCLWRAAVDRVGNSKKYTQHCINRKWVTPKLNLRTNAEAMAEYVLGHELPPEPHTGLEDIIDYELPIFKWLLKSRSWKKYGQKGYSWYEWQLHKKVIPV